MSRKVLVAQYIVFSIEYLVLSMNTWKLADYCASGEVATIHKLCLYLIQLVNLRLAKDQPFVHACIAKVLDLRLAKGVHFQIVLRGKF